MRVALGTSLLVAAAGSCTSASPGKQGGDANRDASMDAPAPLYGAPPPVEGPCGEIARGAACSCQGFYYPIPDSGTGTSFYCSGVWEFGDFGTLLTASNCAACAPDAGPPKDSGDAR
jgi:hypothetical protein